MRITCGAVVVAILAVAAIGTAVVISAAKKFQ